MERSSIREIKLHRYELIPDFATLNPGYACRTGRMRHGPSRSSKMRSGKSL